MLVQSVKLELVAISLVVGLVGCTTVPQEVDQPDPQVTVDIKKVTVNTKPVDLNSIVANAPKTNPIVKPVTKPIARPPIVVQASVTPKPKVVTKVPATKETTPVSVASKVSEPNKGIKPSDIKRYIPVQASNHLPTLKKETDYYFPTLTFKHYFGGLIEQESCISLTHSKCWNPKSSLKTKREEGAGLGLSRPPDHRQRRQDAAVGVVRGQPGRYRCVRAADAAQGSLRHPPLVPVGQHRPPGKDPGPRLAGHPAEGLQAHRRGFLRERVPGPVLGNQPDLRQARQEV